VTEPPGFAQSRLVSDHAVRMGGTGKGPSPGELLLSGLLASTVMTGAREAWRLDLDTRVVARGVFRTDMERVAGPLAMASAAKSIPLGETKPGATEARWRISAASLGEGALIELSNQTLACGGYGPSPAELLLGGLAACTAIYLGRNAVLNGIPVEGVQVTVRAPATLERIGKHSEISAALSAAQFETLKYCADHCAIGETLLRGMAIADEIALVGGATGASRDPHTALAHAAPPPPASECEDGSCCIVLERGDAARAAPGHAARATF